MVSVLARPRACLFACFVVLASFLAGAVNLSINADTRVFFSQDNANRRALDQFEARYTSAVDLFIVLHAADGDVFEPRRLEAIRRLTTEAWTIPYATRVDSIANAPHIASDADGIVVTEMFEANVEGAPDTDAAAIETRVMDDALLVRRLIAEDGATTGLRVLLQYPTSSSTVTEDIISAAKALPAVADAQAAGFEVWYGGRVASSYAFSSASKTDLKTLIPLNLLVMLILLTILLRSIVAAGVLFATACVAAASMMGLAGWFGVQISAATAYAPTVIIALGVAALSHLVLSARRHARAGFEREAAIARALKSDARPIALTLSTTCLGFLTLNFADAPPFREFGSMVAAGSAFCLFYGLMLLPALMTLVGFGPNEPAGLVTRAVKAAAHIAVDRRRGLLIAMPLAAAVAVAGLSRVAINDRFPDYFTESFDFRRHTDLIEEHLTGVEVLEFDIAGADENAIYEPDYQEKLARFEAWLGAQPKVVYVASVREIFKRLNQHMTNGDPAARTVPADSAMLAQYMLMYEMSLPMGQSLTNAVTIDKSGSRLTAIMRGATTRDVRDLRERAEAWFNDQNPTDVVGVGTGLAVMFAYLSSLNVQSMIGGTAIAAALISGVLVFAFGSLRYGFLSLTPNLLPAAAAFGVWGYLVGEVGVAVSTVGAMTLGIIVDDTIHLIWRYREARARGEDPESAVKSMFTVVGEPMLISTIALVAGFSVLAASGFHITKSTGILTAGTVASALILDWFLLPPLLIAIDNKRSGRAPAIRNGERRVVPAVTVGSPARSTNGEAGDAPADAT